VLRRNPFAAHDDGKRFARRHVDRRLDFSAVAAIIEAIVCFPRAALRRSSVDPHLRHACRNDERLRAAGEIEHLHAVRHRRRPILGHVDTRRRIRGTAGADCGEAVRRVGLRRDDLRSAAAWHRAEAVIDFAGGRVRDVFPLERGRSPF
jgi:hypothetical protein